MIVNLHKYLIFGLRGEVDKFFSLAQRAGFLEFIGHARKKALEMPDEAKTLLAAIKIAKHHPTHPKEAPSSVREPLQIAESLLSFHSHHEALLEEERLVVAEIARIAVFGDFSREELNQIERETKRVVQFFCMKSSLARTVSHPPELIYVGTEYDLDYFMSINKEPVRYAKMVEIIIERPVGVLRARLNELREEKAKVESQIRTFSNALPFLQHGLTDCLNAHHLALAKHDASLALNETVFAIEAWVPETKIQALYGLLGSLHVECEEIAIEPADQIPTCMENRGAAKVGEDLVHVYDTPAYTDKDPSLWVLCFFAIFFAMIISDAGYGLLFLLTAFYLKWKLPHLEGAGKRALKLMFLLATSCILWGVATASYFGMEIGPNHPLRQSSFIHFLAMKKAEYHMEEKDEVYASFVKTYPEAANATDGHDFFLKASKNEEGKIKFEALDDFYDNILMECSFLIGILHLSLSFLRYLNRNWAGLGWVIFMIGGYLFFPSIVDATTMVNFFGMSKAFAHSIGLQLIILGIAFAFFAALIKHKWGAFNELLNAVQVFADVLSYLRLYALALGGIVMAHTFNDHLGIDLGIVATVLIIVLGHANNIVLCIMGGVIHGLRLNFLEWYRYSFEGGGRLFNPLRLMRSK